VLQHRWPTADAQMERLRLLHIALDHLETRIADLR